LSEKHHPFFRPLKKKGFKEERVTKVELYDLGISTTLESNKSLDRKRQWRANIFADHRENGKLFL